MIFSASVPGSVERVVTERVPEVWGILMEKMRMLLELAFPALADWRTLCHCCTKPLPKQ